MLILLLRVARLLTLSGLVKAMTSINGASRAEESGEDRVVGEKEKEKTGSPMRNARFQSYPARLYLE